MPFLLSSRRDLLLFWPLLLLVLFNSKLKKRHIDPERSRTGKRFFAAKHVISTVGGAFAAAVERSLYFVFALVLAPALRKPSWKLPPWQN
jgi:hypothetical protein